ncbi:hypothetical protein RvY_02711 [Ramazzottius varieornatus]|uniref:Uncharacterized protein n=1 Tax=Ramazzottius varieornatus TaxID=947166 RepID=A0A1D1UV84_RAMVA|nr:hypothetical protein RvY_02711 [Ramazzottius varieornatus]
MALGDLIRTIEGDYKAAGQREAQLERLIQEKKAQLQEQGKRITLKREANAVAAIRSAELAGTAKALETEVQRRRESLRNYYHQIDALNIKIQLQEEQNAKDEKRKLAERSEMERRLEANVDKYQSFPEAQKLANLELERNLLQKVTKLGKMKASNLEQGVGHGQGAFESSPELSTQPYRDFCNRFAEKSLVDRTSTIQHMETEPENLREETTQTTTSTVVNREVTELDKEVAMTSEIEGDQSPAMNRVQNEAVEAEQDMQVDEVHRAPFDVMDLAEPAAEELEKKEQAQENMEQVIEETAEVPREEKHFPDKNNFDNFARPSSQNLALPSVKLPPAKLPAVSNFPSVSEKSPVARPFVPAVLKEMNFDMPTSTSRSREKEPVKEVDKEKHKDKAFEGFSGFSFGSASPAHSETSTADSEDEGFGFLNFGPPKQKAVDKPEEKNQGNVPGFGKQHDKKETKKPGFFLDF